MLKTLILLPRIPGMSGQCPHFQGQTDRFSRMMQEFLFQFVRSLLTMRRTWQKAKLRGGAKASSCPLMGNAPLFGLKHC